MNHNRFLTTKMNKEEIIECLPFDIGCTHINICDLNIQRTISKNNRMVIDKLYLKDKEYNITERFLTSLASFLGIGRSVFRYFEPQEVLDRVKTHAPSKQFIRFNYDDKNSNALAITSMDKNPFNMSEIKSIINKTDPISFRYNDGILSLSYAPKIQDEVFDVMGDRYNKRFVVEIPLDAYGDAFSYLSIIRIICQNGMYLSNKLFSSRVKLGTKNDKVSRDFIFSNYVSSFNDSDGYDAISERLEIAMGSKASLKEYGDMYKQLDFDITLFSGEDKTEKKNESKILSKFIEIGGDPLRKYGIVNFDTISDKRARLTDVDCTVYDLIQFATEYITHNDVSISKYDRICNHLSNLISNEYDLERSIMKNGNADINMTLIKNKPFFIEQ